MSLFELPVSRGARMARVVAVLLLDLVLAGAGIAMIASYLHDRAEAAVRAEPPPAAGAPAPRAGEVHALDPAPVDPAEVERSPSKPAHRIARGIQPSAPVDRARPEPDPGRARQPDRDAARDPGAGADTGPDSDIDMDTPPGAATDPGPGPNPGPGAAADSAAGAADTPTSTDTAAGGAGPGAPGGDDGTLEPDSGDDQQVAFSAAKVRQVVDRHRVQLQKCYQRAAKHASPSQPLEGRVDIQFVIMSDGNASSVRPVANTTGSDQLAECVKGLIEGWQFPSPGPEEIAFVWPFVFKAP